MNNPLIKNKNILVLCIMENKLMQKNYYILLPLYIIFLTLKKLNKKKIIIKEIVNNIKSIMITDDDCFNLLCLEAMIHKISKNIFIIKAYNGA